MNESCKDCFFWRTGINLPDTHRLCKASPPTLLMQGVPVDSKGQPVKSKLQTPVAMMQIPQSYFPVTVESEWCGGFRPMITNS